MTYKFAFVKLGNEKCCIFNDSIKVKRKTYETDINRIIKHIKAEKVTFAMARKISSKI